MTYEVRDGVRFHMPWGTASDIAWFRGDTLIEMGDGIGVGFPARFVKGAVVFG